MSFAKVALVTALFGVSSLLQGCGCDKEKVTTCLNGLSVPDKMTCGKNTGCYKDNNCCDYEENGMKMKDALVTICTGLAASGDKTTNACA